LSINLAKRVLETEGDCVIPVIRPSDSIIFDGNYLDRERVFLVQTPQKVKRELFLEAYSKADKIYPDEGSLIKGVLGIEPTFVEGERWNFKITYPEDLEVFGKLKMESLNLFGYDTQVRGGEEAFFGWGLDNGGVRGNWTFGWGCNNTRYSGCPTFRFGIRGYWDKFPGYRPEMEGCKK
jgi:hypothetical protein